MEEENPFDPYDIKLICNGRTFEVHKRVLAKTSGYFKNLIEGRFEGEKLNEVEMKDSDPYYFEQMLKFAYRATEEDEDKNRKLYDPVQITKEHPEFNEDDEMHKIEFIHNTEVQRTNIQVHKLASQYDMQQLKDAIEDEFDMRVRRMARSKLIHVVRTAYSILPEGNHLRKMAIDEYAFYLSKPFNDDDEFVALRRDVPFATTDFFEIQYNASERKIGVLNQELSKKDRTIGRLQKENVVRENGELKRERSEQDRIIKRLRKENADLKLELVEERGERSQKRRKLA